MWPPKLEPANMKRADGDLLPPNTRSLSLPCTVPPNLTVKSEARRPRPAAHAYVESFLSSTGQYESSNAAYGNQLSGSTSGHPRGHGVYKPPRNGDADRGQSGIRHSEKRSRSNSRSCFQTREQEPRVSFSADTRDGDGMECTYHGFRDKDRRFSRSRDKCRQEAGHQKGGGSLSEA